MKLLTKAIEAQLRKNAELNKKIKHKPSAKDFKPVLKVFNPCGGATWLFTELDEDGDTLFGLCDLGMGEPELGYVSLKEISEVKNRLGLGMERDRWFTANKTLREYAEQARIDGYIRA